MLSLEDKINYRMVGRILFNAAVDYRSLEMPTNICKRMQTDSVNSSTGALCVRWYTDRQVGLSTVYSNTEHADLCTAGNGINDLHSHESISNSWRKAQLFILCDGEESWNRRWRSNCWQMMEYSRSSCRMREYTCHVYFRKPVFIQAKLISKQNN